MSRTQRAFIVSILLHLALVIGLAGIRYDVANVAPSFRITLVEFDGRGGERDPTAEAAGENSVDPSAEPIEQPAEAPRNANRMPAETRLTEPEPRADEVQVDAEPSDAAPAEAAVATRAAASDAQSPRPADVPDNIEGSRLTDLEAALEPVLTASIPLRRVPPPATARLAERELAMLEAQAEAWVQDAAELAANATELSWTVDGQTYQASFALHPARDSMGIDQVIVDVHTDIDGQRFGTELRLNRMAFSSFAQFIDRWDPSVRIHDDEIEGRFHSNSEIFVENSRGIQPVFHGKVTTARSINTSSSERRVRRNEVFLGGIETRVGRIALPKRFALFTDDREIDPEHHQRFDRDARIVFAANGTYSWQYLEEMASPERVRLPREPYYLVGADKVELYVQGEVDGKVLVYSPEGIVIEGDLVYAAHPELDAQADDLLGLVSDKQVEIAAPETTGPGDLDIHASIYAKRRFAVRNYRSREGSTLRVYGSVTAGSLSATEPRYRTELLVDPRLTNQRPPHFPMTDRFEAIDFDGRWTALAEGDGG